MALPLVRETTSTLEYCVKKTCLKFTDFMLLNDLKAFMLKAKLKHMKNLIYKTGHQISRKSRLTIMFSIVNLLIVSLILPLYLFSSPVMKNSYPIKSGSIKIDLVDRNK